MMNEAAANSVAVSLDKFAAALIASTAVTHELSDALKTSDRIRARRTLWLSATTALVVVLIILNSILAVATLRTQAAIQDCTDPAGTCAQRNAETTVKAINSLNQAHLTITYLVNRCQLSEAGKPVLAFESCVTNGIQDLRKGTLKAPQLVP